MARRVAGLTYVDVFGQQLVGHAVFVDNVVVHAGAGGRRSEKESEQSGIVRQYSCLPISSLKVLQLTLHGRRQRAS